MSLKSNSRRGVACAGNWIVDHVKIVDVWPSIGYLSNILAEERGTGGAPFNVLVDLARLEPSLPLRAMGLVGDDADGHWILDRIRPLASDVSGLAFDPTAPTSYTDVITLRETGQRTFFHMRGANAHFDVDHVKVDSIGERIFHLGYMFLLDALDRTDPDFGSRAARLLAKCRGAGLRTSIDMVSAEAGRYAEIVVPALRHTDYCIINELEAQSITGRSSREAGGAPDWGAIESSARAIADLGVVRVVVIHLPEGAVALEVDKGCVWRVPSIPLPPGFIRGTAGAGDAFCAGMLLGLHEDWPMEKGLRAAHAAAAASLRHATCTEGICSLSEALELADGLERATR
jgi:sugar/nucleoside kinase (ribokinase family)